ncbi:hypothetical protein C5N14_00020 [Micromonospora sp. MW-13]|nr:hypothetical protein C5N14_00020 [Micromonospora sp. MW-13]
MTNRRLMDLSRSVIEGLVNELGPQCWPLADTPTE